MIRLVVEPLLAAQLRRYTAPALGGVPPTAVSVLPFLGLKRYLEEQRP